MNAHYSLHIPKCDFYQLEQLPEEKHEDFFDEHEGRINCSCPNTEIVNYTENPSDSEVKVIESDLLLLVSQRSNPTIKALYDQGYSSLVKPTIDLFNTYVQNDRQAEILKFVWTDLNMENQKTTLQTLAEKNLAVFALEYSLFLESFHERKSYTSEVAKRLSVQNYLSWNRKGLILARLDICCIKDGGARTLTNAAIRKFYKRRAKILPNTIKKLHAFISQICCDSLPSPTWAKNVRHKDEFFPQDQWQSLREQELAFIQQNEKTLLW